MSTLSDDVTIGQYEITKYFDKQIRRKAYSLFRWLYAHDSSTCPLTILLVVHSLDHNEKEVPLIHKRVTRLEVAGYLNFTDFNFDIYELVVAAGRFITDWDSGMLNVNNLEQAFGI